MARLHLCPKIAAALTRRSQKRGQNKPPHTNIVATTSHKIIDSSCKRKHPAGMPLPLSAPERIGREVYYPAEQCCIAVTTVDQRRGSNATRIHGP